MKSIQLSYVIIKCGCEISVSANSYGISKMCEKHRASSIQVVMSSGGLVLKKYDYRKAK